MNRSSLSEESFAPLMLINSDPEISQEMFQFLGSKYQAARQELRELKDKSRGSGTNSGAESVRLKEENAQLKDELVDMRLRLEAVLEGQDGKTHLAYASPYDDVCRQLAEALEERERLETQHAEQLAESRHKIQVLREKYKTCKESRETIQNSLDELQHQYNTALLERDAALARATERDAATKSPSKFLSDFLSSPWTESSQPRPLVHISKQMQFAVPNEAKALCAKDGTLIAHFDDIIWPRDGTAHCLLILPMHRYNAKAKGGNGSWENSYSHRSLILQTGQKRDLFHKNDYLWYYYGIFENVGTTIATLEDLRQIGSQRSVDYVLHRTVLHSELVPPLITRMVRNMYDEGALRVYCIWLRCVGFNHDLDKALRTEGKSEEHVIPVPKEGSISSYADSTNAITSSNKKRAHRGSHS